MNKRTVEQLDAGVDGKRALVRVDFNVPIKDGAVGDDTRIRAALPTIRRLKSLGCRIVLLSHLGRPKGGGFEEKYSLRPVARALEGLLGSPVVFIQDPSKHEAVEATRQLPRGGVALVENTRFYPGEEKNDLATAQMFAALGDFYVNDAFGSAHRAHASTEAVARLLKPAVAGLLMQKELDYLGAALASPKRPFVAVLGGAKISGKIDVIENLLPRVDHILIGGAMACTFFRAKGAGTGTSLVEEDRLPMAKDLLARAGAKLVLPDGGVIASSRLRARRAKWRGTRSPTAGRCTTSTPSRAAVSPRSSPAPGPWCGTGPWACSRRSRSTRGRWRSRRRWRPRPPRAPPRSWAAATRPRRSRRPGSRAR